MFPQVTSSLIGILLSNCFYAHEKGISQVMQVHVCMILRSYLLVFSLEQQSQEIKTQFISQKVSQILNSYIIRSMPTYMQIHYKHTICYILIINTMLGTSRNSKKS